MRMIPLMLTTLLLAGPAVADDAAMVDGNADAGACQCDEGVDSSPIDLGEAPEPEQVVTIAPSTAAAAPATGFGADTRTWLELQNSGSQASTTPRPLPGEAATQVYERYIKSFAHPIPERFNRESFAADSQ